MLRLADDSLLTPIWQNGAKCHVSKRQRACFPASLQNTSSVPKKSHLIDYKRLDSIYRLSIGALDWLISSTFELAAMGGDNRNDASSASAPRPSTYAVHCKT